MANLSTINLIAGKANGEVQNQLLIRNYKMSDLYVSWSEYHQTIEQLAIQVYESHWEFNQIVCIAKGGLRVGDILSRIFEQPLAILSASSYGGKNYQTRGELAISEHLSMTTHDLGEKVLLVDDLVDSGNSLQGSINWLQQHYSQTIQDLRTAVLWCKPSSVIIPDYYVYYLESNPWIHQPFENYEKMTITDLVEDAKFMENKR